MTTEIATVGDHEVVRFWGGDRKGPCLQVTTQTGPGQYVRLTQDEVRMLIPVLKRFLGEPLLPMNCDPATGRILTEGIYPEEYRENEGPVAWIFNPWTGQRRDLRDVGTDPLGLLIEPPEE